MKSFYDKDLVCLLVLFVCFFSAFDLSDETLVDDDGAAKVQRKSVKLASKRLPTTTTTAGCSIFFENRDSNK